jgi:tetratricopeptide (TPR) repeat protein
MTLNENNWQHVMPGGPLDALPKHPEMSTKRAEYLPDSRKPEVEELCERESSGADLVLCIHGPAGIGKSTLAGHLSDTFRSAGRLAASIFLGALPTDALEPEVVVKMVAREIGSMHPSAIPKIVEAIGQCHGASLETHLRKYIIKPLRSLKRPQPLIIIVDAMDEWPNHPLFFKALACLNSQSHIVKFILTGRLNPCASHLPGIEKMSIYTYALGPISKEVIKAYFRKHLQTVPWVDGRIAHPADVEKLTELSGGLPVWAATVIALLSHQFSDSPPHEILEEIVGSRRPVGGPDGLGELYRNALVRLFPSLEDRKQLRRYLGATMALQEPLSLSDFSTLSGIRDHLAKRIQFALSAIQTRSPPPGSETMVHPAGAVFHLSLLEYVQAATSEPTVSISAFDSHSTLGLACLNQLLSLPPSSSVSHLRGHQRYAVKYWLLHVSKGTPRPNNQWLQTEHCLALQRISAGTRRQWATLFLETLIPRNADSMMEDAGPEDGIASTLGKLYVHMRESGEDCWGFQVACLEVAVRIDDGAAKMWSRLGGCYRKRGRRTGSLQMYEEAVVAFRYALRLRTNQHPDRAESLTNVAIALIDCYNQNGNIDLLHEAASLFRKVLDLCPAPHPNRPRSLNNLAGVLLYKHDGGIGTLKEAILLYREALGLRPAPHPDRPSSLNNLASALQCLYKREGGIGTLNEAISLYREALGLRPAPHPDRPSSLNNLALALQSLYDRDGGIGTLNEANSLLREALGLHPALHPYRPLSLNNLASALQSLYEHDGGIGTLSEAISLYREALGLHPAPHPDRPSSLYNLALALQSLYDRDGGIGTLNEAISLLREALGLHPAPHPDRPLSLNNLANALQSLYKLDGGIGTLNEAISLYREVLGLRPAPHPDRPSSLQNLADTLLSLFEENRAVDDLDEAISLRRELLVLSPPGKRYRKSDVIGLVQLLVKRREATGDDRDRREIRDLEAELAALRGEKAKK